MKVSTQRGRHRRPKRRLSPAVATVGLITMLISSPITAAAISADCRPAHTTKEH